MIFEPIAKIKRSFYRCDSKFYVDDIIDMYKDHDVNGVIFTDGNICNWYEYKNGSLKKLGSAHIHLQNQFKNGGQSVNRLRRNREIQREQHLTSLSEKTIAFFYDKEKSIQKIKNIMFCGPAEFKIEMAENKLIRSFFENIHIVTMGGLDLDIQILNEAIEKIEDPHEKIIVAEIKKLIALADSKLVFGKDIAGMLSLCLIKTLYVHKDSDFLKDIQLDYDVDVIKISSDMINEYGGVIGVKFY
jgi:peptide subunit release factor 1 (eRF1)